MQLKLCNVLGADLTLLVPSWGAKLRPLLYLSSASLYWPARYLGSVDNVSRSRDV